MPTIYVDSNASGSPPPDGTVNAPYTTLFDGLTVAGKGTTIFLSGNFDIGPSTSFGPLNIDVEGITLAKSPELNENETVEFTTSLAGGAMIRGMKSNLTLKGLNLKSNGSPVSIVEHQGGGHLVIDNCKLTDTTGEPGVKILNAAKVTVLNSNFSLLNGAIKLISNPSIIDVKNSTFKDNGSGEQGGAISLNLNEVTPTTVIIEDTIFDNNSAEQGGGAIAIFDVDDLSSPDCSNTVQLDITIERCSFLNNDVLGLPEGRDGGAILIQENASSFTIKDSHFIGNSANRHGGVLALFCTIPFEITSSQFIQNSLSLNGGSMRSMGTVIAVSNVESSVSSTPYSGLIEDCLFERNEYMSGNDLIVTGHISFSNSLIQGSIPEDGNDYLSVAIRGCTFDRNIGTSKSGAITAYLDGAHPDPTFPNGDINAVALRSIEVSDCYFVGNQALMDTYGADMVLTGIRDVLSSNNVETEISLLRNVHNETIHSNAIAPIVINTVMGIPPQISYAQSILISGIEVSEYQFVSGMPVDSIEGLFHVYVPTNGHLDIIDSYFGNNRYFSQGTCGNTVLKGKGSVDISGTIFEKNGHVSGTQNGQALCLIEDIQVTLNEGTKIMNHTDPNAAIYCMGTSADFTSDSSVFFGDNTEICDGCSNCIIGGCATAGSSGQCEGEFQTCVIDSSQNGCECLENAGDLDGDGFCSCEPPFIADAAQTECSLPPSTNVDDGDDGTDEVALDEVDGTDGSNSIVSFVATPTVIAFGAAIFISLTLAALFVRAKNPDLLQPSESNIEKGALSKTQGFKRQVSLQTLSNYRTDTEDELTDVSTATDASEFLSRADPNAVETLASGEVFDDMTSVGSTWSSYTNVGEGGANDFADNVFVPE